MTYGRRCLTLKSRQIEPADDVAFTDHFRARFQGLDAAASDADITQAILDAEPLPPEVERAFMGDHRRGVKWSWIHVWSRAHNCIFMLSPKWGRPLAKGLWKL